MFCLLIKRGSLINESLLGFSSEYSNVEFIDPNDFLCIKGGCMIINYREPIHSDLRHLSVLSLTVLLVN